MIIYDGPGDLFECGVQTVVCPVNTVQVMGKGLALAFKQRVPGLEAFYKDQYPSPNAILKLAVFDVDSERKVLLFPTKQDWRQPGRLDMIHANLVQLANRYTEWGIMSLGIPLLGCGVDTGQLDWLAQVKPIVYQFLDPCDLPVKIMHG